MSITNWMIVKYLEPNGSLKKKEFEELRHILDDVRKQACGIAWPDENEFQACLKLGTLSLIMAGFLAGNVQTQSRCLAIAKDIIKMDNIQEEDNG